MQQIDTCMLIYKEFHFDAAHYLPHVPEGHKCRNMHGHTYHVKLMIEGELDPTVGWVIDFGIIKKHWKEIEVLLDHTVLNDIEGLENPTAEIIAQWIFRKLKAKIPMLSSIELKETPTSGVIYKE